MLCCLVGITSVSNYDLASRMLVSSTRKPMSYINLAKRFLSEHGEVHLSALGVAIGPMVTVAEILKSRELAVVSRLRTSLEDVTVDQRYGHTLRDFSCRACARVTYALCCNAQDSQVL